MTNYKIVSGRIFRGAEAGRAENWLNDNAARGWDLVSALPIVEDGHAMYVFRNSASNDVEQLIAVPEEER